MYFCRTLYIIFVVTKQIHIWERDFRIKSLDVTQVHSSGLIKIVIQKQNFVIETFNLEEFATERKRAMPDGSARYWRYHIDTIFQNNILVIFKGMRNISKSCLKKPMEWAFTIRITQRHVLLRRGGGGTQQANCFPSLLNIYDWLNYE